MYWNMGYYYHHSDNKNDANNTIDTYGYPYDSTMASGMGGPTGDRGHMPTMTMTMTPTTTTIINHRHHSNNKFNPAYVHAITPRNSNSHSSNTSSNSSGSSSSAALETIQVMRRQEESAYLVPYDYLAKAADSIHTDDIYEDDDDDDIPEPPVDWDCRLAMRKWCGDVAKACHYQAETVEVALNCLDRFLTTSEGTPIVYSRHEFQLAAMTCLYLSIKIHECQAMDAHLLSSLSHYKHAPQDIERMERTILQALQWRVNPPTAISFVRSIIPCLSQHMMDDFEKETILEMALLQLETFETTTITTSSLHFSWLCIPASYLAFAAVLNAVESVVSDGSFGFKVGFANFETTILRLLRIDRKVLRLVRDALYEAIHGGILSDVEDDEVYEHDDNVFHVEQGFDHEYANHERTLQASATTTIPLQDVEMQDAMQESSRSCILTSTIQDSPSITPSSSPQRISPCVLDASAATTPSVAPSTCFVRA